MSNRERTIQGNKEGILADLQLLVHRYEKCGTILQRMLELVPGGLAGAMTIKVEGTLHTLKSIEFTMAKLADDMMVQHDRINRASKDGRLKGWFAAGGAQK